MKTTGKNWLVVVAVLAVFGLTGCASVYQPPPVPVCASLDATGSVICAIAEKIGSSPEQMNDMLLDASLIGIGTKITTGAELEAAVGKVQAYVTEKKILTVSGIIKYLVEEAKIDPALALLLSRRLVFLQVPGLDQKTLTPFDIKLIEKHLANQVEQLSFF